MPVDRRFDILKTENMLAATNNRVYIAATETLSAPLYPVHDAVEVFYPKEKTPKNAHKMARLLGKNVGIQNRAIVIEPTCLPKKQLCAERHSPKQWGLTLLDKVTAEIEPSDVGFISVAYNVTSHQDILPNLACQIAMEANLGLDERPSELPYYGCAAGIFAINAALEYCRTHQKAAFVYVFDQCTWISNPIYDTKHPNFRASLRTHLLFGDGAVGLLLVPESMCERYSQPLMEVIDTRLSFQLGNVIKMENSSFLVGEGVAETMPALVTQKTIKPLLEKHSLTLSEIAEWSIHQGGIPVLEAFRSDSILGLSEQNIHRSKSLFEQYGNFSSPSCLYVLNSFFQEKRFLDRCESNNAYGLVVGFGAGYYLGSLLYQWA